MAPRNRDRRRRVLAKRAASDVLTTEDVARRLGIGRNETLKALREGRIPSLRLGRRWLVPRAAFERMLNGEPETPAAA